MDDDPSTRARRVYHMGNLLQKRGEVKEAAKMYRSAVKLDPMHKASHYNLGQSLFYFLLLYDNFVFYPALYMTCRCVVAVSYDNFFFILP